MSIAENIKKITRDDLQILIDNRIAENKELEYKNYTFTYGKLTRLADQQKNKLVKEIVAFANTIGGTIIMGIQENEDRIPTIISGVGFSIKDFDEWLSSFRQLILSRIRPHIHGVDCIPVELSEDNIAIVIFVPKSYSRPHSFWDGNKDEFFMRYANGITYMDIDDLRKAFVYSSILQDKIEQFRRNRISMILANECVGNLGNDAKLVIHLIPEWSFEIGNNIDLEQIESNPYLTPISSDSYSSRYNADGYCIFRTNGQEDILNTYTQVFRNGIIEIVEIRLISNYKKGQVYDWYKLQEKIITTLERYGMIIEDLKVPKPWHLSASLLNAKGYVVGGEWIGISYPIERDIINSIEGICTEDLSIKVALKPVLDSMSNAFGYSKSGYFE